jgi:transcriptional regulator with XRE-family HTH domain
LLTLYLVRSIMHMSEAYTVPEWTVGDRLRKARESAGIGVAEMALRLGVSRNTITNYEHDHRAPSLRALREWSAITGVPISWLIEGDEPEVRSRCFSQPSLFALAA